MCVSKIKKYVILHGLEINRIYLSYTTVQIPSTAPSRTGPINRGTLCFIDTVSTGFSTVITIISNVTLLKNNTLNLQCFVYQNRIYTKLFIQRKSAMFMQHTILFSIIFYIVCFNMMKQTIYFKFTYISERVFGITMWIHKSWESFGVVNNILSIHSAGDIKNCRNCFCGENIVLITQCSIYFRCCI